MLTLKPNKQSIRKAVEFLKEGKVIVYPTETSYALGCDATNDKACKRIFRIKKRSKEKKLPIIVANLKMAKEYAYFNKDALKLAKTFWPGPLTLLLKKKRKLSRFVGKGIRISSNPIARELSKKLGKPIVATSANISGRENCYSIKEVLKQGIKADLYLDAGKLKKVKPSTIFDVEERKIIREGPISFKKIMKALKS
jgi:L-threonylcarbamoyladenylate synthase